MQKNGNFFVNSSFYLLRWLDIILDVSPTALQDIHPAITRVSLFVVKVQRG